MQTVELGGVRLHVLVVQPGLAGESDRASSALAQLDPATVILDVDTDEALRLREGDARPYAPGYVDGLYAEEVQRRFTSARSDEEHPFVAVARVARNLRSGIVALRAQGVKPGLFASGRARRAARSVKNVDASLLGAAFAQALHEAGAWDAALDAAGGAKRLERALDEARAPIVLVVPGHRAAAWQARLAQMPRRRAA